MSMAGPELVMIPVRVARAERIAEDIHVFELRDPGGADLPEFSAGAHVSVKVPSGLLRKYSLCNDPAERDRYVIAVKRETNGRGGFRNPVPDLAGRAPLPAS